ncbi:c-type cytochrome [Sphingomonas sp. MMS12-HWE2-04]|uniref:c-type cytochrome n=1 Tax=Sphingomonas sp. MMS12-HWE2-04 TaxID=3234199 RepID=UPI00385079E8
MRRTAWGVIGAGALFFASAGGAAVAQQKPASPASDVIAGRQAAFRMSGALFNGLRTAAAAGGDVSTQVFAARALSGWAKAIPGMFPAGSDGAPSGALPSVWKDRAGFEARAADYAAATAKLAELAKAGDAAGFAAQVGEVGKTCGACHSEYRKPG